MSSIIINGRFLVHRITGVERYAREIIGELDRIANPGEFELAVPPEVEERPTYENISVVPIGGLRNRLWEHLSFPRYVREHGAVSLNLCNVAPLPDPGIVCIHDMKIQARPGDFSRGFLAWYRLLFWNETKRAKLILTVSEFSKKEICKYYQVDPERILVIPNGWQHFERVPYDEGALAKYGLVKGKYCFSLSSMEPNKNFKWIAEAARNHPEEIFAVAGSVNETVFAGGPGFERPENMKLLGYISDGEARTLMRDCRAFLFPTFYEGFGIPPLEAMAAGCRQVVVSDTEVMHEVFGSAVRYIDPTKPSAPPGSGNSGEGLSSLPEHGPDETGTPQEPGFNEAFVLSRYSWAGSARKLYDNLKRQGFL